MELNKPSRKTSVDVHLERTSTHSLDDNSWFTRAVFKLLLTIMIALANIAVAVLLAVLQSRLPSVIPLNSTMIIRPH